MKTIILILAGVLAYLGSTISIVWAIVEFVLYIAKDKPFNWWSIWTLIICIVLSFALFILGVYLEAKSYGLRPTYRGKGGFQNRLERMQKEREENSKQPS